MSKLLHIDTSPLEGSISHELTKVFAADWKTQHSEGEVIYRNLAVVHPAPIDAHWIGAAYTPPDARTPEQNSILAISDDLVQELEEAEEYVFGVAMHNFSIPSTLKLWIDQVVRTGRTFAYGEGGPKGLLLEKRATVIIASGGVYPPDTPAAAFNHVDPYLKTILGFIGITEVQFISAAGVAQMSAGRVDRETFLRPSLELVHAAAAASHSVGAL